MRRLGCLVATLVGLMSVQATAQQWPTKAIRVVVPLTAGSAVDIVPRIVLEQVAAQIVAAEPELAAWRLELLAGVLGDRRIRRNDRREDGQQRHDQDDRQAEGAHRVAGDPHHDLQPRVLASDPATTRLGWPGPRRGDQR